MLTAWLELPGVGQRLAEFSAAAGLDLTRLGTTAGAEEITDTAITQPLLVAAALIAAEQLALDPTEERVVAGHSVGELAAAAVAGALSGEQAVAFAARRGAAMAAACALTPTGMSAVLGGKAAEVLAALTALDLTPANRNAAGQIVAAGALEGLAALADNPPAGARVRPLSVAGAFHTEYMRPAEDALQDYVADLPVADPRPILLSNADGSAVTSGPALLEALVRQVTLPVRWDLCQATCTAIGVDAIVELAPGGTLTGIARREMPGAQRVAIKSPDDLAAARALIAASPAHGQGEHTPELRIVVTPVKGVFTRSDSLAEGDPVGRGTRLGTVRTNRDEHPIVATEAGVLAEWLRGDDDIVAAGLPVARLEGAY